MKIVLLLSLLAAVSADEKVVIREPAIVRPVYVSEIFRRVPSHRHGYEVSEPFKKLRYSKAEETRGDRTEGGYSVLLPDGRTQTVTYVVDGGSGFQAKVSYSGVAEHPEPLPQPIALPAQRVFSDDDGDIVVERALRPRIGPVLRAAPARKVLVSDSLDDGVPAGIPSHLTQRVPVPPPSFIRQGISLDDGHVEQIPPGLPPRSLTRLTRQLSELKQNKDATGSPVAAESQQVKQTVADLLSTAGNDR